MWSGLWPFLLTAGLTLAIASFVQFYAVPRVETRKRREDRWERDLLALGELLTFEQPQASDSLFDALSIRRGLWDRRNDVEVNKERLAKMQKENDGRVIENGAAYRRMDARVDWLADRAMSIDKHATGMRPLWRATLKYRLAAHQTMVLSMAPYRSTMKVDQVDALREDERQAVREMVMAIKALIGHPPPWTTFRARMRQRLTHTLRQVVRKQAQEQAKREAEKEQATDNG